MRMEKRSRINDKEVNQNGNRVKDKRCESNRNRVEDEKMWGRESEIMKVGNRERYEEWARGWEDNTWKTKQFQKWGRERKRERKRKKGRNTEWDEDMKRERDTEKGEMANSRGKESQ
jgi:hypothetical protein